MSSIAYDNYFPKLFANTNSTTDPYKTNSMFVNFNTGTNTFESIAQPQTFMKNINSISLVSEKREDVVRMISEELAPTFNDSTLNIVGSTGYGYNNQYNLPATSPDLNTGNFIRSIITRDSGSLNSQRIVDIINSWILNTFDNVTGNGPDYSLNNKPDDSTMMDYQARFNNYLNMIMLGIGGVFFSDAVKVALPKTSTNANVQRALDELRNLYPVKISDLQKSLNSTLSSALLEISTETVKLDKNNDNNNLKDLAGNKFTSQYYYKVREKMLASFVPPKTVFPTFANTDVLYYIKHICVDLYLKVCYPYVQYSLLVSMRVNYDMIGDFVNSRWGYFVMVMYVYNWVKYVMELTNDRLRSGDQVLVTAKNAATRPSYSDVFSNIFNNINHFLAVVNNNLTLKLKSGNTEESDTKSILVELRKLSDTVVNDSWEIARMQSELSQTQTSLRSANNLADNIAKTYNKKVWEFWILFMVIIIFIIASAVLIILDMGDWAIAIALLVAACVIVYKFIMMLITFFFQK